MNTLAAPLAYRVTPSRHARSAEQRAEILAGELGFAVRHRRGTVRTTTRAETETRQVATVGLVF